MEIEIEIISKQTIRPASSTPESSRIYRFSFLDQIAPPIFMPLIYFYPGDGENTSFERSRALKESLSRVLTAFYPLSGRVKDDLYVLCDNQGTPFIEAKTNFNLSQVIDSPVPRELNKFLAYELDDVTDIPMAVQITYFRCHGIAVGLLINHKLADATSLFMFVNAWSAAARWEDGDMPQPIFEADAIFPSRAVVGFRPGTGIVKEDLVTKIFTFPAFKISILRDRYAESDDHGLSSRRRPTRVEALSAFLWSRFVAGQELEADTKKEFAVIHAVNLRTRMEPPLSEYYFGNIFCFTMTMPSMENRDSEQAGQQLVRQVHESVSRVDGDYIATLKKGDEHLNFIKKRAAQSNKNELVTFSLTSLCRFPLYEADFGWGKPVWVSSASLTYKNLVTFFDTPSGDGIEAWINMKKGDMEKFEADLEFKSFASPKTADGKLLGFQNFSTVN